MFAPAAELFTYSSGSPSGLRGLPFGLTSPSAPLDQTRRAADLLLDQPLGGGGVVAGEEQVPVAERRRVDGEVRPDADRVTVGAVDADDGDGPVQLQLLLARVGDVLVSLEGLERAVVCGAVDLARAQPDPRRLERPVGLDDRLGDPVRCQPEDAGVEEVAAERLVAAVVGGPDGARRRVAVGRREDDVVAVDAGPREPVLNSLDERVREPAEIGLDEGELLPLALDHDRASAQPRVDALAGLEALRVEVLVRRRIGDQLHPLLRALRWVGDPGARRVGEHRSPDRRCDVSRRRAGADLGRPVATGARIGAAGSGSRRTGSRGRKRSAVLRAGAGRGPLASALVGGERALGRLAPGPAALGGLDRRADPDRDRLATRARTLQRGAPGGGQQERGVARSRCVEADPLAAGQPACARSAGPKLDPRLLGGADAHRDRTP